jgi:hypothetical protein
MMPPIVFDEKQLIPSLPYYDLPAGLMVPLVPLEEIHYKPIDPKKIRNRFYKIPFRPKNVLYICIVSLIVRQISTQKHNT